MNKGSLFAILASVILAAVVAWLGNAWIEQRLSSAPKPPEMIRVLVASKDIPIDTKIDQSYLASVEIPPASAPEGYVDSAEKILGKRLKEAVYKGEIILGRRFLDDNAASVLSVTLTPGKRAVAVRVDDIIGVSGFILPGSHVDVMASGRGQGVRTVLQDIKVLTVGEALRAEGGNLRAGSVTLEVDPRQAEILMEATEGGSVRLALRHQLDRGFRDDMAKAPDAGNEAKTDATALAAKAPEKPKMFIAVIRGMSESRTGAQWDYPTPPEALEEAKP